MLTDPAKTMEYEEKKIYTKVNKTDFKNSPKIKKGIILVTWNVQGTRSIGALKNLALVLKNYKVDIAALQETKQKSDGISEVGDYIFFNSGKETDYFGTGFMIHKSLRQTVLKFDPISDRICKLRLRGKYRKISIVNVHAPTNDKTDEIKEKFYENLREIISSIPKYDIKLVIGDFNAKIGKEEIYKSITGGQSLHTETNENGEKIIQFAMETQMKIMSTLFQRKNIYKGTWVSPDGKTCNQIDHVLIERVHAKIIVNIKTQRGAMASSDHFMVKTVIKQELPELKGTKGNIVRRYDVSNLENEDVLHCFRESIGQELIEVNGTTVDKKFNALEEMICKVSEKYLRKSRKSTRTDWFDDECKTAIAKKNTARIEMLQNNEELNRKNYEEERRKVKKICRAKKRKMIEQKLEKIQDEYENKHIRNFYHEIRKQKIGYCPKMLYCKNKKDQLVTDAEKLNRWSEYFCDILNEGIQSQEELQLRSNNTNEDYAEPPTSEEILEILKEMKNYRSPGENGIPAEIYKTGGETLQEKITSIIQEVWKLEEMPKRWNEALLCPIYKKGDRTVCSNYRGIALLDIAYKILAICLRNRLKTESEKYLGEYQAGFRSNRSTMDQVFTLKLILANSLEYNLQLHLLFIDYKQAYDSINREKLIGILNYFGIPPKLIRLIKMTIQNTVCKVLVDGKVSSDFKVKKGLRQGDPLSPILFNLVLEWAVRESKIYNYGSIYHHTHQILAYADDITIIARSKEELEQTFQKLNNKTMETGLIINEDKTKHMLVKRGTKSFNRVLHLTSKGKKYSFGNVSNFNYLGVNISDNGEEDEEIKSRLSKGSKCAGSLYNIMKNKKISRSAKIRLYKTVIRPTVLYGSELWILNKINMNKLEVWERKMLRKIYGGKRFGEIWLPRSNKELSDLYGEPSIVGVIKSKRLRWLGHVSRLSENRIVKLTLKGGVISRRRRGRPKEKWINMVKKDLTQLHIKNWEKIVLDRVRWRKIVHEAMGLLGLES